MQFSHKYPTIGNPTIKAAVAETLECGCACGGLSARMTQRPIAGHISIHMQCENCGKSLGTWKKIAFVHYNNFPQWDRDLWTKYRETADPDVALAFEARQRARQEYRDIFLASPEWKAARELVMSRANRICEACLSAPASDVHHVSYGLDCMPPAWELRAICRRCHDDLHGKSAAWAGR